MTSASLCSVSIISVVTLLSFTVAGVASLRCVQCNSTEDTRCLHGVGPVTKCRGRAASCVTFVGLMPFPGPDVVTRGCTESELPDNFCMPVLASNHKHFLCINTCRSEYCNNRAVRRRKKAPAAQPWS